MAATATTGILATRIMTTSTANLISCDRIDLLPRHRVTGSFCATTRSKIAVTGSARSGPHSLARLDMVVPNVSHAQSDGCAYDPTSVKRLMIFTIVHLRNTWIFTKDSDLMHVDTVNAINAVNAVNAIKWPEPKSVGFIIRPLNCHTTYLRM